MNLSRICCGVLSIFNEFIWPLSEFSILCKRLFGSSCCQTQLGSFAFNSLDQLQQTKRAVVPALRCCQLKCPSGWKQAYMRYRLWARYAVGKEFDGRMREKWKIEEAKQGKPIQRVSASQAAHFLRLRFGRPSIVELQFRLFICLSFCLSTCVVRRLLRACVCVCAFPFPFAIVSVALPDC